MGRVVLFLRAESMSRKQRNTPMVPRLGAFLLIALLGSVLVVLALLSIAHAFMALWSVSIELMVRTSL